MTHDNQKSTRKGLQASPLATVNAEIRTFKMRTTCIPQTVEKFQVTQMPFKLSHQTYAMSISFYSVLQDTS